MGVYLNMKIDKNNFNLGRSHNYIAPGEDHLQLNSEILHENLNDLKNELVKKLNAIAAHHPTYKEITEAIIDIEETISDYTTDIERVSRCLVLSEIKENIKKVDFKVE